MQLVVEKERVRACLVGDDDVIVDRLDAGGGNVDPAILVDEDVRIESRRLGGLDEEGGERAGGHVHRDGG